MKPFQLLSITLFCLVFIASAGKSNRDKSNNHSKNKKKPRHGYNDMTTTDIDDADNTDMTTTDDTLETTDETETTETTDDELETTENTYSGTWDKGRKSGKSKGKFDRDSKKDDCWGKRKRKRRKKKGKGHGKKKYGTKYDCDDSFDEYWLRSSTYEPLWSSEQTYNDDMTTTDDIETTIDGSAGMQNEDGFLSSVNRNGTTIGIIGCIIGVIIFILCVVIGGMIYFRKNNKKYSNVAAMDENENENEYENESQCEGIAFGHAMSTKTNSIIKYESSEDEMYENENLATTKIS